MLDALEEKGIQYFGAGMNLSEALQPAIVELNGNRIALFGFGWKEEMCVSASEQKPGVAPLDMDKMMPAVENVTNHVDKLAVNLHWGYEYEIYPLPVHRKMAYNLIDGGVDLIIGHHSHLIQAHESYKGKWIYYGLGNFYYASLRDFYPEKFADRREDISEATRNGLGVMVDEILDRNSEFAVYYDDNKSLLKKAIILSDYSPDISS